MLPPSNLEFKVTIAEPIQTITNTWANSGPPSAKSELEEPCKMVAMKVQRISGPQRSHSLRSATGFSLGYRT